MEPPTSVLPGIKKIPTTPHDELRKSVEHVRTIYNPPVRGSRRRKSDNPSGQSGGASELEEEAAATSSDMTTAPATRDREGDALAEPRSDAFERNYVIRWLTNVVAYLSGVLEEEEDEELEQDNLGETHTQDEGEKAAQSRRETERLLADTAALLAVCAGTASAGVISRVFAAHSPLLASLASSPPTIDLEVSTSASSPSSLFPKSTTSSAGREEGTISINLRDVPLDNQDYGSVGAQTWGGACVMAEMVVEDPTRFGLLPLDETDHLVEGMGARRKPLRVLELGAGTGLVSLAIASFYRALFRHDRGHGKRDVEIVATDYYPSVLENLEVNLKSNGFGFTPEGTNAVTSTSNHSSSTVPNVSLNTCSLDWSTCSSLGLTNESPLDEPFDMAFGADIVYEEQHAVWIKGCLQKLLRRPLGAADTTVDNTDEGGPRTKVEHNAHFHLIIPLRSTHTFESGTIETVFKSLHQVTGWAERDAGADLVILEKETIVCEVEEGGRRGCLCIL